MWKNIKQAFSDAIKLTKWYFLGFLILSPLVSQSSIVYGYFQKLIVDTVSDKLAGKLGIVQATDKITTLLLLLVLVMFLFNLFSRIGNYVESVWINNYSRKLRLYTAYVLKDLPLHFFESESVGWIQEKISAGVDAKTTIVNYCLDLFLPEIAVIAVSIPIMASRNLTLMLIGLSGLPFFITFRIMLFKRVNKYYKQNRKYREDFSAAENELYHQIKIVKAFNKTGFQLNQLKKLAENIFKAGKSIDGLYQKFNFLTLIVNQLSTYAMLFYACFLALHGRISIGDILLFVTYTSNIYQPLWSISRALNELQAKSIAAGRLDEILQNKSEFADDSQETKKALSGDIVFKNVGFSYQDNKEKQILKNASLEIKNGSVAAFVGPSGVGKSTIVKLLLRFSDPNSGSISIGQNNIQTIAKKTIRNSIGLVFQDSLLFNDTVASNIKFGRMTATRKEIIEAAKKANADEFIKKLPRGYDTIVGERGVKLSGGEQQRINLARAILKNPSILILDEATSSLDSENERLVQEALWRLIEGRTTIIIAHRLATVMRADKIFFINNGRVVEEGTHNELLEKDGLYAKYFKLQTDAMFADAK